MSPGDERPGIPPRSYSLNIPEKGFTAAPLAAAVDFQVDGNEEKKRSDELVAEAQETLQHVEDGWSPKELCPVVPKLVDRVQQLVRPSLEAIKSMA